MTEIDQIKARLLKGDQTAIAKMTGLHRGHVCDVFAGRRSANTKGGRAIMEAARRMIAHREELKRLLNQKRK